MKLPILFENHNYIIVDKPSGLLSIPDRFDPEIPNAVSILRKAHAEIFVVHRLDRDTSGCLCFAKNTIAHAYLSKLFEHGKVTKIYEGIVHGSPSQSSGTINQPIAEDRRELGKMMIHAKGKPSQTSYVVKSSYGLYSHVQFNLHTGRTHQIRVHAKHIGHPIVCDSLYGDGNPVFLSSIKKEFRIMSSLEEMPILSRLALHASQIAFEDENGNQISAEASMPKVFKAFLNQCHKWLKKSNNVL